MIAVTPRIPIKPRVLLALSLSLLCSCAGIFRMSISAPQPEEVGSLFVLLGKAEDFEGKTSQKDLMSLIMRSELQDYVGYAEYTLDVRGGDSSWRELSTSLPDKVRVVAPAEGEGPLAVRVHRGLLKPHPELAVAIVMSSADGRFHLKVWETPYLKETDQQISIGLTAEGLTTGVQ